MLTMKLCADMDHVKKLCEFQGLPFDGNIRAFCCEERGEETGYCLFSTKNGQAEILAVSCGEDDFLADGLIRGALSFCSGQGVKEFVLSPSVEWKLAEICGVDIYLTNLPRNIEEFFAKYKNCAR